MFITQIDSVLQNVNKQIFVRFLIDLDFMDYVIIITELCIILLVW
jgi:hypothetical protein